MSYSQQQRSSHVVRNVGVVLLFLALGGGFFLLPVVTVESFSVFGVTGRATVSVSYQVLHCGEVHQATSSAFGSYDKWSWVC
jgi:hypothetical protein